MLPSWPAHLTYARNLIFVTFDCSLCHIIYHTWANTSTYIDVKIFAGVYHSTRNKSFKAIYHARLIYAPITKISLCIRHVAFDTRIVANSVIANIWRLLTSLGSCSWDYFPWLSISHVTFIHLYIFPDLWPHLLTWLIAAWISNCVPNKCWWKFLVHSHTNNICNYIALLGLKLVHVSKGGPRALMLSYKYRKSHCGDNTILRPSYLHNGISYTGKTRSLYWIGALVSSTAICTHVFIMALVLYHITSVMSFMDC